MRDSDWRWPIVIFYLIIGNLYAKLDTKKKCQGEKGFYMI